MKLEGLSPSHTDPMDGFSEEEKRVVTERLRTLSALCYYVSQDFSMNVEVNSNDGWHWDFQNNIVRCDKKDLLEKPMDYLRFVIQHKAGHRKISRVFGVIPDEVWNTTGFSFMTNAIEDPRDNNFVRDAVPHFSHEMKVAYTLDEVFEAEMKEKTKEKTGTVPRFMQAGFEYIKMWFAQTEGIQREIDATLPEDVQDVVRKTLTSAMKSWNTYPTKEEADTGIVFAGKQLTGEETVIEYARAAYTINVEEVWPLFKTLIDKDIEEEGKRQQDNARNNHSEMTQEEAIEKANQVMQEIEKELNDFMEGEKQKQEAKQQSSQEGEEEGEKAGDADTHTAKKFDIADTNDSTRREKEIQEQEDIVRRLTQSFEKEVQQNETSYETVLRDVAPLINNLENELRDIFVRRRANKWGSGYRRGKRINVQTFIQEEARDISVADTKMFMKHELPHEEDYAIEILVDLSGSMRNNGKIHETFKAVVVLAEVLNTLGIKISITGFNDHLISFQNFGQTYDDELRNTMTSMTSHVDTNSANYTDDGYAVDSVSKRLLQQEEKVKLLFVLSDGEPAPSHQHSHFDLKEIVTNLENSGKVRIIGLGIGRGTEHVTTYYKEAIANVDVKEFAKRLSDTVKNVIEGY